MARDAADAVWSETNPNYFPPLPGEDQGPPSASLPVEAESTAGGPDTRKWPDDFRGFGSNVLPKRVRRSTK